MQCSFKPAIDSSGFMLIKCAFIGGTREWWSVCNSDLPLIRGCCALQVQRFDREQKPAWFAT